MLGTTGSTPKGSIAQPAQPIYLTDLDQCLPQTALAPALQLHHWRVMEYTTDLLSGNMLMVSEFTDAPEISYPLRLKGWHSISVGVVH